MIQSHRIRYPVVWVKHPLILVCYKALYSELYSSFFLFSLAVSTSIEQQNKKCQHRR